MKKETLAIHGANFITDSLKPVIQPITLSTTFTHQDDSMLYGRLNNPNRLSLEKVLASFEQGADAAAFASGNAAGNAVFQALPQGAHMIAPDDMYHGLKDLITSAFSDKIEVDFVDLRKVENFENAIKQNTRLLWIETPSNPLLHISDIRTLSDGAHKNGIQVVCDSTFATPIFQQPLLLGADIVMHSNTKYIGGHSDVIGGILVTKEHTEIWGKIKNIQKLAGAVPSPFDTYLLTRSIKTLPYRMKAHAENAGALSIYLESHPGIDKVYYPGLTSHEGHQTAASQMSGFGGMLSFLLKGTARDADRFIENLSYFSNATSLGGIESLIERRAKIQGPGTTIAPNLIRVSVGLENIDDLIEDLETGFASL
ncbi:MAG: aminotransferase class I/II-fold pyridoxal phosphate-dependent enzyme [Cyclobacteriaceae bacterium]